MLSAGAGCSLSWRGDLHGPQADADGRGRDRGGESRHDQQRRQHRHLQG